METITGIVIMGYTKLFSSIVASTIWREDDKTRIVWITMLAMKNERHIVEASIPGLADLAKVSIQDCEMALAKMLAPDKYSSNPQYGGRRIEKVEGGWRLLNGEFYRLKLNEADRKAYKAQWARNYRSKKKGKGETGPERRYGEAEKNGAPQAELDRLSEPGG